MAPVEVEGLGVKYLEAQPGTEYLGGTATRDVVFVSYNSLPSYIYFQVAVPQDGYTADLAKAAALGIADVLETLAALDWVTDVTWGQIPTSSGELQAAVTVQVRSTSGNGSANLGPWAIVKLPPNLNEPKINALHAQLDATENA